MIPIDDPRPFADVLRDWIARQGGSAYAVSDGRLLSAGRQTIGNWLDGRPCPMEREIRALMTLADEGRVPPAPPPRPAGRRPAARAE